MDLEEKRELVQKYILGLGAIWKKLVDDSPEPADPLSSFHDALAKTEATLSEIFK